MPNIELDFGNTDAKVIPHNCEIAACLNIISSFDDDDLKFYLMALNVIPDKSAPNVTETFRINTRVIRIAMMDTGSSLGRNGNHASSGDTGKRE